MTRPGRLPAVIRWCSLLILAVACQLGATPTAESPAIGEARALITRVLPGAADHFVCKLIPADDGYDVFEYEAGTRGTIILRGNSSGALAVAFNQYLRREAHLDFGWLADGPLPVDRPLPAPRQKVHRICTAPERFFLNYCTYGYTMPWWNWSQWERFIDWMAMNGINRPLLQSGQEAVWLRVWQDYGMSADAVRAYFSGPAHLPWHRMANLDRWGGPLPLSYIAGQAKLQQKIVARVRALGMKAILPAFAGHVPPELATLQPGASVVPIRPGWSGMAPEFATHFLDPEGKLFADIQERYLREQTRLYGTDHLYSADPFNEMDPPSREPAYLAGVGDAIFRSLTRADPEARWYQMTWTFTYEKLGGLWTGERLAAMLHSVPRGRMVLLDYAAEEQEFYSRTNNAYGLPFIWNYLGNFGGNTHLSAPLQKCATLEARALKTPNCIGVGSTLEGLGVNPSIYEMLLEQPWEDGAQIDVAAWLAGYADRRAERVDPAVRAAWANLGASVFHDNSRRTGTFGSVFQGLPPIAAWRGRLQHPQPDYAPAALVAALEQLFAASPESQRAEGYRYDVVNFTRQVLCNLGTDLAAQMESAAMRQDLAGFRRASQRFLELGRDLDELLGTRREFLLGSWIEQARSWGATAAEADYFEANAREILTAWHEPGGPLTDYASRQWNGLMRDYYLPRWAQWISLTAAHLEHGEPFSDAAYITWVNEACEKWIHAHADYAATPQGDPVETARRLLAKYRAEITAADRTAAAAASSRGWPKEEDGRMEGARLTVSRARAGALAEGWERWLAAP